MVGESQEIKLINIQDGDGCDAAGAGPGQVFLVLVLSNLGQDQSSNEAQLVYWAKKSIISGLWSEQLGGGAVQKYVTIFKSLSYFIPFPNCVIFKAHPL